MRCISNLNHNNMKPKTLQRIFFVVAIWLLPIGCQGPDFKGAGPVDYRPMLEKMAQMEELLNTSEFGSIDGTYPVLAGENLRVALEKLQLGVSKAKAGLLILQYEVDMYVVQADRDIKSFKNSYQVTLEPGTAAELLVYGTYKRGYIDFGASPKFTEGNAWTIEFWIKLNDDFEKGPMGDIISTFNAKSDGYEGWTINFMGDALRTTIGMGPQVGRVLEFGKSYTIQKDVWKHIATVYDGSALSKQLKMYIDGELFWEKDNDIRDGGGALQNYAPATANTQMWAFQRPTNPECSMVGFMKNFRLWNVAKSQAEMSALMNDAVAGTESGLTCAWDFTTVPEDKNEILDKTGQFNAKIVGMHKWNKID